MTEIRAEGAEFANYLPSSLRGLPSVETSVDLYVGEKLSGVLEFLEQPLFVCDTSRPAYKDDDQHKVILSPMAVLKTGRRGSESTFR